LEPVDHVQIKTESGDDLIASNEQVIASVGVSRGRIYLVSTKEIYCIGKRSPGRRTAGQGRLEKAPRVRQRTQVLPADLRNPARLPSSGRGYSMTTGDSYERKRTHMVSEGLKGDPHQEQFTADPGHRQGQ
jgi:hypothetical protein